MSRAPWARPKLALTESANTVLGAWFTLRWRHFLAVWDGELVRGHGESTRPILVPVGSPRYRSIAAHDDHPPRLTIVRTSTPCSSICYVAQLRRRSWLDTSRHGRRARRRRASVPPRAPLADRRGRDDYDRPVGLAPRSLTNR